MNIKLWKAKRLVRRIEKARYQSLPKFENYVVKIKKWIKEDTTRLNKLLKEMSSDDFDQFKQQTGYPVE